MHFNLTSPTDVPNVKTCLSILPLETRKLTKPLSSSMSQSIILSPMLNSSVKLCEVSAQSLQYDD